MSVMAHRVRWDCPELLMLSGKGKGATRAHRAGLNGPTVPSGDLKQECSRQSRTLRPGPLKGIIRLV